MAFLAWARIQEIQAIDEELFSWSKDTGVVAYDWQAQESMLRGCVGLDVTAFFFMVLYRLAIILSSSCTALGPDISFEIVRCTETLDCLLKNENLHLLDRLSATLESPVYARRACSLAESITTFIDSDLKCTHRPSSG